MRGAAKTGGGRGPEGPDLQAGRFAITVAFELEKGAFESFHRLVSENAATSVAREPDCLRFDVLTPENGGETLHVLLYEIYRDRAAFDRHLASDHYRSFDRESSPLVRRKTVTPCTVREHAKAWVPHE